MNMRQRNFSFPSPTTFFIGHRRSRRRRILTVNNVYFKFIGKWDYLNMRVEVNVVVIQETTSVLTKENQKTQLIIKGLKVERCDTGSTTSWTQNQIPLHPLVAPPLLLEKLQRERKPSQFSQSQSQKQLFFSSFFFLFSSFCRIWRNYSLWHHHHVICFGKAGDFLQDNKGGICLLVFFLLFFAFFFFPFCLLNFQREMKFSKSPVSALLVVVVALLLCVSQVPVVSAGDELGCAVCVILVGMIRQGRLNPTIENPEFRGICEKLPQKEMADT